MTPKAPRPPPGMPHFNDQTKSKGERTMNEADKTFIDTDPAEIGAVRYLARIKGRARQILKLACDLSGDIRPDTADGLKALELALMLDRIQSDGGNLDKFIEEVKAEQESIKAGCKHD